MAQLQAASNHSADQFIGVCFSRVERALTLAIFQNADAIGDEKDLFQTMSNINDADALFSQLPDYSKESPRFGISQRGGRLIKDHQLRI